MFIKVSPLHLRDEELDRGKELLIVFSLTAHILSIMFKCDWICYMHR